MANIEYDKRLENVIEGNFDKDLIIIGSSRGANNILASQLEQETDLKSYNLSFEGSNIVFHEFILKTYIKHNTAPKRLLLCLDHKHTFSKYKSLNFRYDRLFPLSKYSYINNKLIEDGKRNVASKAFGFLRLDRNDFSFKKKKAKYNTTITTHGSIPKVALDTITVEYSNILQTYDDLNERTDYLNAFKNIQDICKSNNIELVYVFTPNLYPFNLSFYKRFQKLTNSNNKIFVFDSLNTDYKNNAYFNDKNHLNSNGAKIFTSDLSAFLNKN
ncbi:hypothetical protein [Lacinutrix salivirga]